MEALEFFHDLVSDGFHLEADGDRIRVRPAERITPEIRAGIIRYRQELLAILRTPLWDDLPRLACPKCPSQSFWLGARGLAWRCAACDPPAEEGDVRIRLEVVGNGEVVLELAVPTTDGPPPPREDVDVTSTIR
jgi:hypothetical protein